MVQSTVELCLNDKQSCKKAGPLSKLHVKFSNAEYVGWYRQNIQAVN